MRTKTAQDNAVLSSNAHSSIVTVNVYDSTGSTFKTIDESTVVEINEDLDSPRTLTVKVLRQRGRFSLSPLVTTSFNPYYTTESRIAVGRRVLVQVQTSIEGRDVGSLLTVFDGFIDEIRWPDDEMEFSATDRMGKLRDTWIERERVYGLATGAGATKGCYVWKDDMPPLVVGDLVVPSDAKRNGRYYRVSAAASPQATTEPVWPISTFVVSGGVTLTDFGATSDTAGIPIETLIQQVLNDNGLGSFATLQTPVSPAWNVKPYIQQRESIQSAIETMADQLGWMIRFVWNPGLVRYELTLSTPDRAATTANRTFNTAGDVRKVTEVQVKQYDIRNVVRVTYSNTANRSTSGAAIRAFYESVNAASVTKYGRRFMEIQEAETSAIDTAGEAQRLADAICSDLADPLIDVSVSFAIDPFIELNDLLAFTADQLRWSSTQTLAVNKLTHRIASTESTTAVSLRGKPASRQDVWVGLDVRSNASDGHKTTLSNSGSTFGATITEVVGGASVLVNTSYMKETTQPQYEIHVSGLTSSFNPTPSTLAGVGQAQAFPVANLVPGKQYWAKVVPFGANAERIVRSGPSEPIPFVAGRARAGHYTSTVSQAHFPLNGNFEHASDDLSTVPFDHWRVANGSWGSSGDSFWGNDSVFGNYLSLRLTSGDPGITSSPFPVRRGAGHFQVYMSVRPTGSPFLVTDWTLKVYVRFYRKADLSDSPVLFTHSVPYGTSGVWAQYNIDSQFMGALPYDVNFCTVTFGKSDLSNSYGYDIGDVFFAECEQADFWTTRLFSQGTIYGASTSQAPAIFTPSWAGLSYATNWGNYGSGFHDGSYCKDALGFVHLRGLIRKTTTGTLGETMFTLPSGYRPAKPMGITLTANNRWARLDIRDNGIGWIQAADDADWWTFIFLDNISFDTR